METPSALLPIVREIHWSLVDCSHKKPAIQCFQVFFVVNNWFAVDMRQINAHVSYCNASVTGKIIRLHCVNSSLPGQNGHHFADDIFICIFVKENFCILIKISLKFVPKGPIENKSALVQVMAWRQTGDKPLPEPMPTQFTDAYMWH